MLAGWVPELDEILIKKKQCLLIGDAVFFWIEVGLKLD